MSGGNQTGTVGNLVGRAMDAVGGAIGAASAATTSGADAFVKNAAIGDRYEIEAARIALARSRSDEVRSAAAKMIVDHTANSHHLLAALEMNETRGVAAPPQGVDTRREKMLKHLDEAPDDKFDTTYLSQQVLAHEETVTLMREYGENGDNPQLRSLAVSGLPVIERHLDHMKMLAGSATDRGNA
jgi:putative membrane protein